MARLDLRDETERAEYGLRSATVMKPHIQTFPRAWHNRADTKAQIEWAVKMGCQTRLEIARAIARKKTPHLISMIEELVSDGIIHRHHTTAPNGALMFYYSATRKQESLL